MFFSILVHIYTQYRRQGRGAKRGLGGT